MKIKLDKAFILQLYCYSYQAERSIHFALGKDWAALCDYYRGDRLDGLRRVKCHLNELVPRHGLGALVTRAKQRMRGGVRKGPVRELVAHFFLSLLGRWVAQARKAWSFSPSELGFMAATLNDLVSVLESAVRPGQQELISLRMDLCQCRSTIKDRCYGVIEIQRALNLEHFWQADWLPSVRLADILGDCLPSEYTTRKSA